MGAGGREREGTRSRASALVGWVVVVAFLAVILAGPVVLGLLSSPTTREQVKAIGEKVVTILFISGCYLSLVQPLRAQLVQRHARSRLRFPVTFIGWAFLFGVPLGLILVAVVGSGIAFFVSALTVALAVSGGVIVRWRAHQQRLQKNWQTAAAERGWNYRSKDRTLAKRWGRIVPGLGGRWGPVLEGEYLGLPFTLFQRQWGEGDQDEPKTLCWVIVVVVTLPFTDSWTCVVVPRGHENRLNRVKAEHQVELAGAVADQFDVWASDAEAFERLLGPDLAAAMCNLQTGVWRITTDSVVAWDWVWNEEDPVELLSAVLPVMHAVRDAAIRGRSHRRGQLQGADKWRRGLG